MFTFLRRPWGPLRATDIGSIQKVDVMGRMVKVQVESMMMQCESDRRDVVTVTLRIVEIADCTT